MFFGNSQSQFGQPDARLAGNWGHSSGPAAGLLGPGAARPWRPASGAMPPPGRRRPHPVREIHARQWPDGRRPHRPQGADRGGQRLVPRRLEERAARQDRLCPPVRAPDVPGHRALTTTSTSSRWSRSAPPTERHDQLRPHQLFPERADHGARPGALDGVGPHGPPARRRHQERLDEQRGVVQNEKRQGDNRPYGRVPRQRCRASFPPGHPTARCRSARWRTSTPRRSTTCASGSARTTARPTPCSCWPATSTWRRHAPRPSNISDTSPRAPPSRARASGSPPAPTVARDDVRPGCAAALAPLLEHAARRHARLRIPRPRGEILAAARPRVCTNVSFTATGWPIAQRRAVAARDRGAFTLSADVKQGVPVERVEAAMMEELQRFIAQGPDQRPNSSGRRTGFAPASSAARTHRRFRRQGRRARRVRGLCRRSGVLPRSRWNGSKPATPADLQRVAPRSGSRRAITRSKCCRSRATPRRRRDASTAARPAGHHRVPRPRFPGAAAHEAQQRHSGHHRDTAGRAGRRVSVLFDGGYVADQGRKPGTASFAMAMLDEGAGKLDSLAIADRAERLGARLPPARLDTPSRPSRR